MRVGMTARVASAWLTAMGHAVAGDAASGLNQALTAEAEALLDQMLAEPPPPPVPGPRWHADTTLSAGFGYKENVLYSAVHEQDSAYSMAEADVFLFRQGADDHEAYVYAFADQRHYFELDRGDDEQSVLTEANWTLRNPAGHALTLQARYTFIDQFFDASLSDADIASLRLRQHEFGGGGCAEWALGNGWYLQAGGDACDVHVVDFDDDYRAWEGMLELGYRWHPSGEAGVTYTRGLEDYEDRQRRSATGDRIDGSPVDIETESLCLFGRWYWDAAHRWRTQLKWTAYTRDDNGGGYYDYQSWRSRLSLRGPLGGWRWEGGLYYGNTDYDVRPSRAGIVEAPLLYRNRIELWLRLERPLGEHWLGFAEVSWEDNDANDPLDVYAQTWGCAGVGYRL